MTWKEIEIKLKKTKTVLVPISPLEQHGLHLPVSTDYVRAYEVAKRAAEKAKVFCLPPTIIGNLSRYYYYPGTVSISPETLEMVVYDMCKSLKDTGFEKIIFISGHAGKSHSQSIRKTIKKFKNIFYFEVSELRDANVKDVVITKNDQHSGEGETSDMIYIEVKKIKMKKAVPSFPNFPLNYDPKTTRKINPTGVVGNPKKATREKGKIRIENAVKNLIKIIKNG